MKPLSLVILLLSVITGVVGCDTQRVVDTELAKLLERNGYAIYTPFRTQDKPGTIFVLATDVDGRMQPI